MIYRDFTTVFYQLLDEEEDQEARDLVRVPFDADFKDYDDNKDGFITYDEFLDTLSSNVPLVDPSEVQKPFFDADIDGNTRMVVYGQLVEPAVCLSDLYDVFLLHIVRDTRQNL